MNAWLNLRLEPYLKNQGIDWPAGVGAVLVAEREGQVVLAADVDLPSLRQIVSVYFELIELDPSDVAEDAGVGQDPPPSYAVRVSRITAGNVPLPRTRLAAVLREQLGSAADRPEVAELLVALEEGQAMPIPALQVDRARRASVTELSVNPVGLTGRLRVWRSAEGSEEPADGSGG